MADFSSFFPTAGGGGGGFTNQKKYSTLSALADANVRQGGFSVIKAHPSQRPGSSLAVGSGRVTVYTEGWAADLSAAQLVGTTFVSGSTTHTVTSRDNNDSGKLNVSFTPTLVTAISGNQALTFTSASGITVNPANDLGLSDGASIGYFMCGGGTVGPSNSLTYTGYGGRIIQGTEIITTASTNLVLTPGQGENQVCVSNSFSSTAMTESTITGGLTLSTANGSRQAGFRTQTSNGNGTPGSGVNGYGTGGGGRGYNDGSEAHGWGGGTRQSSNVGSYPPANFNFTAGDGAILLYY